MWIQVMRGGEEHGESPPTFAAQEGQMLWSYRAQWVKPATAAEQQWKS